MQKYLSSSTILDFEENDMLDDAHQEIMDMHCQDTFETECKRVELKVKLSSIDENECNDADHTHLKSMKCYNISWESSCDIISIRKSIAQRIKIMM